MKTLSGILDFSMGNFLCLRGFVDYKTLSRISEENKYVQRELIEKHKGEMAAFLNLTTSDEAIVHYDDIKQNNLTVSFIPYKTGVTGGDFLIEDYFSWDKTVKPVVDKAIENSHHPLKNLPKLSSRIKKGLEDKYMTFTKEEFEGFITLIEKIVELSKEETT